VIQTITYADGLDNALVASCLDETYDIWISLFTSALQSSPKSHISIKRYIIKVNYIIKNIDINCNI